MAVIDNGTDEYYYEKTHKVIIDGRIQNIDTMINDKSIFTIDADSMKPHGYCIFKLL